MKTGNETDRAEAYRVFRGRDPDVRALLKKRLDDEVRVQLPGGESEWQRLSEAIAKWSSPC